MRRWIRSYGGVLGIAFATLMLLMTAGAAALPAVTENSCGFLTPADDAAAIADAQSAPIR